MNIYTTNNQESVKFEVDEVLQNLVNSYRNEKEEISIIGTTRILIGAGALTSKLLIKDEFVTIYFEIRNMKLSVKDLKDVF